MPDSLPLWTVWLCNDRGQRISTLETAAGFSVSRIANSPGWFNLTLPPSFDHARARKDYMVEFYYRPIGGGTEWFNTYFVRKRTFKEVGDGQDIFEISGPDLMDILDSRIIAYAAGTAQALQTDEADDMVKAVVNQNAGGSATDTDRDLTGLGFSVANNDAAATSITKGFAWQKMLPALQGIANSNRANQEDLYFYMKYSPSSGTGASTMKLMTALGQPGTDRTGNNETVFGKEWGNLYSPVLTFDYTGEVTYVYAGGQGEGENRMIKEVYSQERMLSSAWGRREAFADARNVKSAAAVQAAGYEALEEGRPMLRFSGRLGDTEQTRFGRDWRWGDKVIVTYRGYQFSAVIKSVQINRTESGQTIDARAETTEALTAATAV